ncbi:MAG: DUF3343 domain-containing protein [Desulfuromonadaceae bacterium]|nr:DUF3343 domain-containing protein [Desulfuromonadaceae bacterium]MDD2856060.1 DUF3343 domain-containing protein [Desulfuromonadaceae bacterium]
MTKNGQLLAVFNSAHRVMKAENILKKSGIPILLIPAPRALSTDCGLAIRYESELNESVLFTLKSENLLPLFIYRKDSDTHYEIIWESV